MSGATEREAGLPAQRNLKRGAWTGEEDERLSRCVKFHGETRWRLVPAKAGLNRCPRSCRMRWLNYLKPTIKRGNITQEEEDLMVRLHKLLGNRWALIAGRLPGRTDNEVKNYWKTHLSKKIKLQQPLKRKPAAVPCNSELADEMNGLTQINDAGGRNELRTEPTATAEAAASADKFNKERIPRADDATIDHSSTEEGSTEPPGHIKSRTLSDGDAMDGFDYSSSNDRDFFVGMNLDSDEEFQSFIRSLFSEEA